ncbi:hypothetical protein F5I97DRAFT_1789325, partial [Phlebopus sp. FC_14]
LENKCTRLKFNGYLSNWRPVTNAMDQEDPLSMVLYIIYNSDLVDITCNMLKKEKTLAFVDNTALIAIGKTFMDTHHTLNNMMTRDNG